MINSSLFFLRQCESLDWSDCLVVLLLSATHFRKSGHARLNQGVFLIFTVFSGRRFLFSLPAPNPPPPHPPLPSTCPISSSLREVSTWRFLEQIACSKKTPALQAKKNIPKSMVCCGNGIPEREHQISLSTAPCWSKKHELSLRGLETTLLKEQVAS